MNKEPEYVYTCDMCGKRNTSHRDGWLPAGWRRIIWYSKPQTVGYTPYCREKHEFHICREKFCLLDFAELDGVKGSLYRY